MKRPKYGNHKIVNSFGTFDSELEWGRFVFLSNLQKEGKISGLKRQVEYQLLPAQYRSEIKHLKTKDKVVERLVERPCSYKADFVYERDGKTIVEDCKGESTKLFSTQTPDFKIKKKMMLYFHDIEIKIVSKATFWENFDENSK